MHSPVLSQEEIAALLGERTDARLQSEEDLQRIFESHDRILAGRLSQLLGCVASVKGPTVEVVEKNLSGVYLGSVHAVALEFAAVDLFVLVEPRDAGRLSQLTGVDEVQSVARAVEGWAQTLQQLVAETRGASIPVRAGKPVRLSAEQVQNMSVGRGSHLLRYTVEWSEGGSDIGVLLPPKAVKELTSALKSAKTVSSQTKASRTAGRGSRPAREAVEVQPLQFCELDRDGSDTSEQTLGLVRDVVIPVSAELGRTSMTLGKLMELQAGETIPLREVAGEPARIFVNGSCIARAEITVLEDNFGVRILEIVPAAERVSAK